MRWWVSVLSFVLVGTSHSRWARRYGLEATVRPSFAFYNTFEEIDVFLKAVRLIAEGGTNIG